MADENFLQDARKRMDSKGTIGGFKAKVKQQGMVTPSLAKPAFGKQSNMNATKMRRGQ